MLSEKLKPQKEIVPYKNSVKDNYKKE